VAVIAAAVAGALGVPATASAGGIDSTKECVKDAVYVYDPMILKDTGRLATRIKDCSQFMIAHFMDTQKRRAWQECVMYGINRSVPPLGWEPAISAIDLCTEEWLDFRIRVDPSPGEQSAARPAQRRRRATRSHVRLTRS
jgi:hypothetical protein